MTEYSDKHDIELEIKSDAATVVVPPAAGGSRSSEIIDLRFIFLLWLKWSWIALPIIALGAYLGFRDLQSFQPEYVARMTVAPVGGVSAGTNQVASLLGGFGLSFGRSAQATPFDRLKVMLGSITLARRLQDRHGMLQVLFAEAWNVESGNWIEPLPRSDRDERIRTLLHRPDWSPPSLETLAVYVGGSIKIKSRPEPSFIDITFINKDRDFALEFLITVFAEADEVLREQDRNESESRRAYIATQLASTKLVNSLKALNSMLMSEEQHAMLLGSGLPYAGKIVEPAFVSERPTQPNLRLIFGFPIIVSLGIAFILLTLVAVLRRE